MENNNEVHAGEEHMHAITISREYGSGGGEIAARLANALGWRLVDHEAVVQVAQELGISVTDAEAQDEYVESLGMRLLNGLSMIQPPMSSAMQMTYVHDSKIYHEALRKVIERSLASHQVVIVGRGSQMLLKGRRDVLHVRVIAPLEQRIAYVMRREGLDRDHAQARIHYKDSGRERYLQMQYHQHPSDPLLYDLVINVASLSLDNAVELIQLSLAQKTSRLHVSTGQLGPSAGLPPYPGHSE
ncbi:MAG TPA: cytidylate kinase-like family protein, partial [Ktedonobacteraceae bacterium]